MARWADPDVTPVGLEPGAGAGAGGGSVLPPGADDPFGSRPSVRRPGWVRVAAGALLVVAGVASVAWGVAGAVRGHSRIEGDAVARGTVRDGAAGAAVFTVPAGGRRAYTVYLLFGGVTANSEVQELAVRDTGCVATMPDGVRTTFRGARQGASATIGSAASVGHFSSQPGRVAVRCAYTSSTRTSRARRPARVAYVVTPGTPASFAGGVLAIVGGVLAALGGGALAWWGARRRRPPAGLG